MNKVILIGRLTKNPELRRTNTDIAVVQFTLAVNRNFAGADGKRQADFINCVAWRNQAENLAKYMRQGSLIAVEGQIQTRTYDDQQGQRRYVTEVICDNISFLETKGTNRTNAGFSDVNDYDIPGDTKFNDTELASKNDGKFQDQDDSSDPFEKFKISGGISDDDLPFN